MPEILSRASILFKVDSRLRGNDGQECADYYETINISVITVVLNGERHLEQTIQSVIGQSYDNVEYIIIDGGSTDGTVGMLNRYNDRIDYWISEGDKGI